MTPGASAFAGLPSFGPLGNAGPSNAVGQQEVSFNTGSFGGSSSGQQVQTIALAAAAALAVVLVLRVLDK